MNPKRLEMYNFLSHEHSSLDFSKFDAALILGSYNDSLDESNGSGKSSILESIRWVLFDKSRHKKKDGVVKRDASVCKVVFEFEVSKNIYRITRQRNKILNQSDVTLERWNGIDFETIGCDTNTATDNKIVRIINFNHDVFINSVYFKQGDISIFTESTPGKRKDILKSLLKLDKWDNYQKQAKKIYSRISTQISEKQQNAESIEEIEFQLEKHVEIITIIKRNIIKANKQFKELGALLVTKKSEYQMVSGDTIGKQQLVILEKDCNDSKRKLNKIQRTISTNDKIIISNTALVQKINEKLIIIGDKIRAKKGLDVIAKRAKLLEGKAQEKLLREQLSELRKNIKLEQECGSCLRPITSAAEAAQIKSLRQEKLNRLQDKYTSLSKKIKIFDVKLKSWEEIVAKGDRAEVDKSKFKIKNNSLKGDMEKALLENTILKRDQRRIESIDYISKIAELKNRFDEDTIIKLQAEVSQIEENLSKLRKSIDKLNVEYGSKISNKKALVVKRDKQKILYDEINKLNSELIVYSKLRQYFGKDGIQSIIIENVIDELENYTNEILAKICNEPTSISIQMQKQSESGSWTETFDIEVHSSNGQDEFEAFSGGEKFRISLALRLALSKILSKRMGGVVKFLLLDEVSSSLDAKGLNLFADIVKQLSSEMKILIITHDDRLKDKFDDIIIVRKTEIGSHVSN